MENKIILIPGDLNDGNRDYLPEAIKGSRMVVNENGNSSHVYPQRLQEHHGMLLDDGIEDEWYVYVPESYDPNKKTPLVFSMHGGLMTGWGQCIYTSWSHVADKEGFICVFPNASSRGMWMIECEEGMAEELSTTAEEGVPILNRPTGTVHDYHDVRLVMALLEKMKQRYNIDETRVFIQGMSMGNCMTSQMARYEGSAFAGAAGSGCPTNCKLLFDQDNSLINEGGPMDIWMSRLEHDRTPPHYGEDDRTVVLGNLNYWRRLNGAMGLPRIQTRGDKNLLFYSGERANVVLMDVYNRDHGQTFDDAQLIWDYLFSGAAKNKDGSVSHHPTRRSIRNDSFSLGFAEAAPNAWVHGKIRPVGGRVFRREKIKYHGLRGSHIVRGSYLYAPLSFLTDVFGGRMLQDGETAGIRLSDGRELAFVHGCIGCTIDNRIEDMLCEAITQDGRLYVPIRWFCETLYNLHVSEYGSCIYATDHVNHISRYLDWILSDILHSAESSQRGMIRKK